ncbi:MAG: cell division protein FtsK/SpoIIIE [Amycolatopsis sp.]|uniref:zonular occludens toxin domain-containing protein n=1 Tax=Amycolatopsis sp. TaxID=37632 RepID=UPI002605D0E1|nr:zonular occludens toxin domain-containing protein [Amycolatopsis sp.]MCU1685784.1 cell division protein FtsK/SpoIIIE [Amycolatopsis sp.]
MNTTDDHDDRRELAQVHYLPATGQTEPIEGEIVSEEEYQRARLATQRGRQLARYAGYKSDLVTVGRVTKKVVTHDRTKTAGKALIRNAYYPIQGTGVVVKRWRDTHGANRYERMMRLAEVDGNHERLMEWETRDVAEKQKRHDRVMDWVKSPLELVKAAALGTVAFAGLLLVLGILLAIARKDAGDILAPITAVVDAVAFVVWFVIAYGAFLLLAGTAAGLLYLWNTGRTHAEAPGWVSTGTATGEGRDLVPDEGAIMNALRNLNLAPLNRKIKEGWQPRWVQGTGRDGKGWRTQLELPPGVTVEMINEKKAVLAHNLVRLPVEVWPTEPKRQPGVLDLWVADQGILSGPVDPYPLLTEGTADYFTGVPIGVDQRGGQVVGKLMASNYAVAGIMGSGKTSLVINLLCGAMLDPLVDIEVYVMAYNADYDPMKRRLRTLVKGDEDEHIVAAMNALRALRSEVTLKGKILSELGGDETKLTRKMALADPRMRPKVVVFDECQELFRHEKFGEEAKQLAIKVMMKARKCAITLVFVTPAPSADSLPRDLAKTVSHAVCFAIGDHVGNDAILGTGSHKAGITATSLVAGEDIGTAMASGFAARAGLLRTHHIRKHAGVDEITPIVDRAVGLCEDANVTTGTTRTVTEERDLFDDLAEVLGDTPVRAADVPARLRTLAPDYQPYDDLDGKTLRELLAAEDIRPPSTNRAYPIDPVTIREYIAERDHLDNDDED